MDFSIQFQVLSATIEDEFHNMGEIKWQQM